jgi:hypothetical protein
MAANRSDQEAVMADETTTKSRTTAGIISSFHAELVAGGISDEYAGKIALEFAAALVRGDMTAEVA